MPRSLRLAGLLVVAISLFLPLNHGVERADCRDCEASGIAACWGVYPPDPETLAEYNQALFGDPAEDSQFHTSRWTATATDAGPLGQGDPMTLTYSYVPDGTPIPSTALGEPAGTSNLIAVFDALYGTTAIWQNEFAAVFQRWGHLTGVTYIYEPNDDGAALSSTGPSGVLGVRGDIRIGGKNIDGSTGFNILAANFFPDQGGDMIVDTTNTAFFAQGPLFLRNVVSHEQGHGLGLRHVCPADGSKLLEPVITNSFDGPQHDDIRGAQRLYGDRFEPNNTLADVTDLGVLMPATTVLVQDVGTDDDTDVDCYSFSVTEPSVLDVTLRPVGFVYSEGPEGLGNCPAGVPIDSLSISDLRLHVLDSDGTTVLYSADVAPAGLNEVLDCRFLPETSGPFYLRVMAGAADDVQLYELEITVFDGILEVPTEFSSIQAAIDAACGTEKIEVAPGTWAGFDFDGKDVRVVSTQGAGVTLIEGSALFFNGESEEALLEGLTFVPLPLSNPFQELGEGIFCALGASPTIRRCAILGTQRLTGGGGLIALSGAAPKLDNCLIAGCTATDPQIGSTQNGGGVWSTNGSHVLLTHCTIVGNLAQNGFGGGVSCEPPLTIGTSGTATLVNCIVRGNTPDQLSGGVINVTHSNIEGAGFPGSGNIDQDALFRDPSGLDFRLDPCSPCVDAGDSTAVNGSSSDLIGSPRLIGSATDMGAFEAPYRLIGSNADVSLMSGLGTVVDARCQVWPSLGDDVQIEMATPGGTFSGVGIVLLGGLFPEGALPLPSGSFPDIHIAAPQIEILIDGEFPWQVSPLVLNTGPMPPGLTGTIYRYQAFALDPSAPNGIFAATCANEIVLP